MFSSVCDDDWAFEHTSLIEGAQLSFFLMSFMLMISLGLIFLYGLFELLFMFDLKAIDDIAFDFFDCDTCIDFMFGYLYVFLLEKGLGGGYDMGATIEFSSFLMGVIFLLLFLEDLIKGVVFF